MRRMAQTTGLLLAFLAGLANTAIAEAPRAVAAHVLNGSDDAHLHYVRLGSGSTLYEEGQASGAVPGTMHAWLHVGPTLSGTVTLYTHGGQIHARGSATPHGAGRVQTFAGTLTITGGTGRYAHAHGQGGLYGEFDRRTYKLTIQTRGKFYY
jgi:hypothetical protein